MTTAMFAWASLDDPEDFLDKLIGHDAVTASSFAFRLFTSDLCLFSHAACHHGHYNVCLGVLLDDPEEFLDKLIAHDIVTAPSFAFRLFTSDLCLFSHAAGHHGHCNVCLGVLGRS